MFSVRPQHARTGGLESQDVVSRWRCALGGLYCSAMMHKLCSYFRYYALTCSSSVLLLHTLIVDHTQTGRGHPYLKRGRRLMGVGRYLLVTYSVRIGWLPSVI